MQKGIINKSSVNILILIILITVLSAGIISLFNIKSLNRTFDSIINKDIPELRNISDLSLNISNARTEIYRYVAGYEPSAYLIINSFSEILLQINKLNINQLPESIDSSISQITEKIIEILNLAKSLDDSIKNRNSLKTAQYSSNLVMKSSMLIVLSEKLRDSITDYLLIQQIESKSSIIKTNILFAVSLFVFLMLLLLFAAAQNRLLSQVVESRTRTLRNQLTELNQIKNNLLKSEKRFANLYNKAPVSFFSIDKSGTIFNVNNNTLKKLKYEKDEVIAYSFENFVYDEDNELYKKIFSQLILNHTLRNKELRIISKNNDIINILLTANIDSSTGHFNCVFYDITDKKHLENQLMQSEKMSAIGQLAGGIAHDFNNQLAGIMGYAELLKMNHENTDDGEYADNIITISKRTSELVKQLLTFARKEQHIKTKIDIHMLLKEAEALIKRSIDKKINLIINYDAQNSVINGDPGQVINLFLNLAINSRDAMPEGGEIIISTESLIFNSNTILNNSEIPAGTYIKVIIEDSGTGVPYSIKNNIFEPFFTTKPTGKGTGMGLSLVYSTVKNHGGFIDLHNKKEGGAVFSIYFPLIFEEIDDKSNNEVFETQENLKNHSILIVEDEEILRKMTSQTLSREGYNILTAENGEDAVDLFKNNWKEIDLVLLDLVMPKVNGDEAFFQMQAINKDVKVIIVTGYSFKNNINDLLNSGVKDVIMKPYKRSILLQKISEILNNEEVSALL